MTPVIYDPRDGRILETTAPSNATELRKYFGGAAWLFNPWTGAARNVYDIGSDVFGYLIVPTPENLQAPAKPGEAGVPHHDPKSSYLVLSTGNVIPAYNGVVGLATYLSGPADRLRSGYDNILATCFDEGAEHREVGESLTQHECQELAAYMIAQWRGYLQAIS